MLRFFVSLVMLFALTGCVALADPSARESTEPLTIEPGADAPSLDALNAIPGATMRYDDAARVVYHCDGPATVAIQLDAGPAWKLLSPAVLTMKRGESVPIAIEITIPEGETSAGKAALRADVLAHPLPLPTR